MLSTKAGGLGINLAMADIVILYDIAAVNGPAEGISITIMGLFGLIYA